MAAPLAAQEAAPAAAPVAAPAPADPNAATTPATDAAPEEMSMLVWLIHTSGWIGGVLLMMFMYFVAQVVRLFQDLRPEVVIPQGLIDDLDKLLAARDYAGILRTAKESDCELGQMVAAGLPALSNGLSEARESVDRAGEAVVVEMEKKNSMLAVIGSLGPLIGLLGTLKGMMSSFSDIAKGGEMKASQVAHGISEALLITFEGVAISVPAIFLFAVFKNKIASLSLQAINLADDFIMRAHGSARSKPQASGTSQA
ncbi:MAG: MotA/TolQ/ExbB proton channel family protein [Planctomycetota bacterium]|nr:MAG: MotA/TolQ/ExbB proton channel family protein [Planctomycetota bacterium]